MEKVYWKPYPKDPDMLFRKGFPHNPITCGWYFSTINPTRSGGTCSLRVKEVWLRTVFLVSRGKILVRFVWQGPKQDPLWIYCGLINIMGRSPPFCKSFSCGGGRGKENNLFEIKKPICLPQFYWVPHILTLATCPTNVPRNQCLAETLSFYHTVKRLGIPDSQIILMMAEATQNDFGCLEMSDQGLKPSLCWKLL